MRENVKQLFEYWTGDRCLPARALRMLVFHGVVVLAMLLAVVSSSAADLLMVVQTERPVSRASFGALADYLSQRVSGQVRVEVRRNPLAHWRALVAGERPALVLEDPHFADYRISRAGYRVVAAVDGAQSFSIAVGGFLLLDPAELAGRPVAALPPPALSTLHFLRFYANPVRMPHLVEAGSFEAAAARVADARAVAAVLPAHTLSAYPELTGALALEDLPEQALLVSPDLDEGLIERITAALIRADADDTGRRALAAMGAPGFSRSHAEAYEGFSRLLQGTWGYRELAP